MMIALTAPQGRLTEDDARVVNALVAAFGDGTLDPLCKGALLDDARLDLYCALDREGAPAIRLVRMH